VSLSNADSSYLIRPNIQEGAPTDLTFRRKDFFDFMRSAGRVRPWTGSYPMKWNLTTVGNASAELFVENQALSLPGKRTFAQASLSPWYARAVAAVTGHVMDQIQKGGTFEDLLEGELADALKAIFYLCETTLVGSAQDKGIASIIDDADVMAGLDPAVTTLWKSLETGSIGTLDIADMQTFYLNLTDTPRGADPSAILGPMNQQRNYGNIAGPAATTSLARYDINAGKPYDLGVMRNGMAFNGVPIVPIRSILSSELYWFDFVNDDPSIYMMRDIQTEELGKRNDNKEYVLSLGLVLKVPNRRMHGKMTGITP
jgi:hypothetical protein